MQSGGQGAGIQLQVGLDLAYFRSRLVDLQAVTTGTKLSFGVAFKRLDIQNELNALATNIKKRNYFLEVKTNLASEVDNAKKLAEALARLQQIAQGTKGALPIGTGALGLKKGAGQPGANEIRALYEALAMAGAEGFETGTKKNRAQMVAQIGAVAKDTIAGLLNGLDSQDAKVQAAARSLGESLIASMKAVLGIASPSKEFEKIGKNVGEGFEKGALSSLDNAFDALENKMRQRGKILDTVARGIFRMLGMDPAAMLQQAREQRATPVRTPIAGLLPSFTSRGTREETIRQLTGGGPSVAQGPGMLALSNEALGRRVNAILQEYFKVAEVQVRESFDPRELKRSLNVFSYIAQSLRDAESRTKQARVAESVDSLMQAIDNAVKIAQARVRVSRVQVAELGPRAQGALSAGRVAGLLPAATGRTPSPYSTGRVGGETQAELFARREREARMRSALREMDVMGGSAGRPASPYSYANRAARPRSAMVPYSAGGALVPIGGGTGGAVPPRPPSGGGGGGMGGTGSFGRALGGINLPGTGLVREIGDEFAMATKQVLLFGTAYKALAFLTSFPAQVGQAVGALQSFRNTLKTIAPTAEEVQASNQFILDTVDRYNVPLESARTGFTRLYASMAPAGFKGDEIRELFLGISKTSATLGLGADQVDRVTYAFGQMASKGQFMAEEVTGQLGDVIPGALSIMAEAAGMGIKEFKKAMEDGVFVGDTFTKVMNNVPKVLEKEFGKGAEGAAKTFQGLINRMQNSTRLLYEAFEPVAVGFLNSVVVPLTSGIKTVADGFNAFFTGTKAKTAGGSAFAQELEKLKPAFEGIRANITALMPALQGFGGVLLEVGKVFLQIAANPFVGYLARVYLSVLPLVTIIKVLNLQALIPMIGSLLRAVPAFLTFNSLMLQGNRAGLALKTTTFLLGSTSAVTAGQIRLMGTALVSLGMPAVLLGIGALIERFMMLKGAVDGVRQSTQQMVGSISSLANTGAVKEIKNIGADTQKQIATFKSLQPFVSGGLGNAPQRRLTEDAAKKMEELGLGSFVSRGVTGPYVNDFLNASRIIEERLKGLGKTADSVKEKLPLAEKAAAALAKQVKQGIEPIPEAAGTDKTKQKSLESYYSLQDQLAKNFTQAEIDRLEAEHQRKVDLIKAEYDLKELRANSFQKDALKFERRMAEIALERQGALLKASNAVMAAQGSVAGGASGGKALGAGIAQYITGDPSSPFYRGDHGGSNYHEHLAFVSREAAEEAYKKLTSAGVRVTEFKGKSPVGRHTPGSAHYEGLAFDVPGAQVPVGKERELTARVQSILGIGGAGGAGAARKVPGSEKRDIVADQKVQIEQVKQSAIARQAEAKAIEDAEIALADFVATVTPVEEQKLQNDLLKRRTELMMQGYSDSAVDQAMKFAEAEYKVNFALKLNDELEKKGVRTKAEADAIRKQMTEGLTAYSSALEENTVRLRDNQLAQAMTVLKDRMAMAGAITRDQELREQIRQKNPDFTLEQQEGLFQQEKLVQGAEKLKADMQGIASSIGDAFGNAFKGIITGSMTAQEALAGFFQSVADHFADMVAKMIAEWLKAQLIQGFMSILGPIAGGLGGGGSALGGNSSAVFGLNTPDMNQYAPLLPMANGGVLSGGFQAFANGGIVTGPTLGLVGEGRYNEAVIPLPDGKSVPVDLGGAMGGQAVNNIVVSVDAKGSKVEGDAQESKQLGRVIAAAIQQELVKQKRPGGLLA